MNWARHFREQSGGGAYPPARSHFGIDAPQERKIAPGLTVRRIDLVSIVEQVLGGLVLIALGALVYRGAKRRQI